MKSLKILSKFDEEFRDIIKEFSVKCIEYCIYICYQSIILAVVVVVDYSWTADDIIHTRYFYS